MKTPWYKKPLILILIGIIGLTWGTSIVSAVFSPSPQVVLPPSTVQTSPPTQTVTIPPTTNTQVQLSNDNYYQNVDGNTVHSPAYTPDNSIPAGATAQCRDGTYSFSQHRSGTCSHHGGVARWL